MRESTRGPRQLAPPSTRQPKVVLSLLPAWSVRVAVTARGPPSAPPYTITYEIRRVYGSMFKV
jgi:hypothetical protein